MRTTSLHKGQGIGEIRPAPESITIEFHETFPDTKKLANTADQHAKDAKTLEEALRSTLPGGTYDHLYAAMTQRQASLLVVSYASLR